MSKYKISTISINYQFMIGIVIILLIAIISTIIACIKIPYKSFEIINIAIQATTLMTGIIAIFFGLRQLVENRYDKLIQQGYNYLKDKKYSNAIKIWNEALAIKKENSTLHNLAEALLLSGDFNEFDRLMKLLAKKRWREKLFNENKDKILINILQAVRQLIVENIGKGKEYLSASISISKKSEDKIMLNWDFKDLKNSDIYKKLTNDCDAKKIIDNCVAYFSHQLQESDKFLFETGNYTLKKGVET